MNSHTNINQKPANRQPSQHILKSGQKVYLYGETQFTGILIRPIERTYSLRWTVELDRGGYDSAVVSSITPIAPQPIESNSDIPFSDEPKQKYEDEKTVDTSELEEEIIALKTELAKLKAENHILKKDLDQTKQIIRRAKDISPLMRISFKRVLRLAHEACMDVKRTLGGWILKMGDKARRFRRLADIWDILSQDNWYLSEIFAPDKLVPLDLILPPRPRKPPVLPNKQTRPLIRPEEVLRRRRMGLPKCG